MKAIIMSELAKYSFDVYYKKERIDGEYMSLVEEFDNIEDALKCRDELNRESFDAGTYHITYLVVADRKTE